MFIASVFVLAIGLTVGSFFNVVIYRLPKDESLWYPSSHCPKCGIFIKWYDNIPLISYLFLKGKCRNCQDYISWRYPLVEALTGTFLLIFFLFRFPVDFSSLLFSRNSANLSASTRPVCRAVCINSSFIFRIAYIVSRIV